MPTFVDRLKSAWNVFRNYDKVVSYRDVGVGLGYNASRPRMYLGTERSILSAIYTRIGIDVAAIPIRHVRLDEEERYKETIKSGLNNCLSVEANIDQTGRAFIQDAAMSLCDEGAVALVAVDTSVNPETGSFDVLTMRTAKITQWYPYHVEVNLFNQDTQAFQRVTLEKRRVAIIENPLYSIMNEPNSTLKRLVEKLNLLDAIDQQSGSGKLDVIIQLPYVIKTDTKRQQADLRRTDMINQLQDSKYGVAYIDGTEKVTQLNRPAENNLLAQIEYLTGMLYGELGLTKDILDGVADEKTMVNYFNRTVEPILGALTEGLYRTFLTKTARTQGQSIMHLRDPFKLVPVGQLAELVDKFTRNEVLTSNEFRQIVGRKPSSDKSADELRNKNIQSPSDNGTMKENQPKTEVEEGDEV